MIRAHSPRIWVLLPLMFFYGALLSAAGELSRYFPERGPAALHQREIDLGTAATVMVLAGEPGEEDLATMTELRMNRGARVVAVYLTNGGGTASDDRDEIPYVVAGRRKEESYRALATIGCLPYYLNCRDILNGAGATAEEWERDSVWARLTEAINRFRPDVVLIAEEWRSAVSGRSALLARACMAAAGYSRDPGAAPWKPLRVFMEVDSAEGSVAVNSRRLHPYWKKTLLEIAGEAWREYASLRLKLGSRPREPVHWYREVAPAPSSGARSLLGGIPPLTKDLDRVGAAITLALQLESKKEQKNSLVAVAEALARIENLMVTRRGRLDPLEERVLARWKDGLEDFRCSLDDVGADVQPSDSILAERQVFFLRVKSVHFPVPADKTEIFFPTAGENSWVINESRNTHFPLKIPAEFRVLSPEKLPWNYPVSLYGLGSSEARTSIPYFIVHRDTDRTRNFALRGEIPLLIGPGRALQVLTPVVRITSGEELTFRLYNITRQPMKAEAWVKDSVVADSRIGVFLSGKDDVTLNRLPLSWVDTTRAGDHVAEIRIGRVRAGQFLSRSLDLRVDSSVVAGLLTGMPGGILETTLRRLHVRLVILDSSAMRARMWERCTVVIVDRNALALRPDFGKGAAGIRQWIEAGGRVLLFPQHGAQGDSAQPFPEFRFENDPAGPGDTVDVPDADFGRNPNTLSASDWEGWQVGRSTDRIIAQRGIATGLIAGLRGGRNPLVLRASDGRGSVTAVALDLGHQLETLQSGACRIFVNLLSR